ncbi:MAG: PKD domain-containing protein [Chitinophagales bacterium]|nr:PKD domain-containing protein [Chitinophagales bacterium]MDW8419584.1 PKD domain-containing protein [Chitinophagales bacterium]
MRRYLTILFCTFFAINSLATHIVGGYISYRYISGTTYEVNLIIYRDCNSTTPFDGAPGAQPAQASVGLFLENTNTLVQTFGFVNPVITTIQPPSDNPCLSNTSGACVEQGVYTMNITLPSATTGYTLIYERCCRNGTITNVFNPGDQGAVYAAYIPPTAQFQNSSPTFNSLPPLFICVNAPLVFNYSATDADGDILTYSLCTPSHGGSVSDPAPNPPLGPPYNSIPWASGYSLSNLLGGNPPLSIDPNTGVLTGRPNTVGQFVFAVCVSEYRNGNLIATYMRDYQVNVVQCNSPIANIPSFDIDPQTGIGTYIINCENNFVQFQNSSYNPPPNNIPLNYEWDFGDPSTTTDVSSQQNPSYTYPGTGTYLVRLVVTKGIGNNICSDTTYAYVKIYNRSEADFSYTPDCANRPIPFTDLSNTTNGNITEWLWKFGDGTTSTVQSPTHIYNSSGTYNVTLIITNEYGCNDTITKPVTLFPTPKADFLYTPPCIYQPVTFYIKDTSNIASYQWNLQGVGTFSTPSFTHTFNTPGSFTVTLAVTSSAGCADTATVIATVQTPVTVQIDSVFNACAGYPVQLIASGGMYYEWFPKDGMSQPFSATPVVQIDTPTQFMVVVSNDCFSDTGYTQVYIRPIPWVDAGNDTTIYRDTYAWLSGSTNGVWYYWHPSTWIDEPFSLTTKAQPRETTWYELFAHNEWGCYNKDSVLVTVIYNDILFLPTAFTPNGDGINDMFRILRWLNVESLVDFSVYNRWGQKVFQTNDITSGWDGTFSGRPADMGVYVWQITLRTGDDKTLSYKGNVTLLR